MLVCLWQHFCLVERNFHIIYIMTKAQVGSLYVATEILKPHVQGSVYNDHSQCFLSVLVFLLIHVCMSWTGHQCKISRRLQQCLV